jgi:hypothetical protein
MRLLLRRKSKGSLPNYPSFEARGSIAIAGAIIRIKRGILP